MAPVTSITATCIYRRKWISEVLYNLRLLCLQPSHGGSGTMLQKSRDVRQVKASRGDIRSIVPQGDGSAWAQKHPSPVKQFPWTRKFELLKTLTYPSYNSLYRTVELFQWFPFKVSWRFLLLMLVLPKSLFRLFLKHKHDETTRIFTWCPQKDKWRPNE